MKTLKKLLLFVVASALLAGCTSYKNVPYMQNPEVVNSYREAKMTLKTKTPTATYQVSPNV